MDLKKKKKKKNNIFRIKIILLIIFLFFFFNFEIFIGKKVFLIVIKIWCIIKEFIK
jgi:hypothetical protein